MYPKETIPLEEIAQRLGVNRCRIEKTLRQGTCPFGFAVQSDEGTQTRWKYICSRSAFEHWLKYGTCPVSVINKEGEEIAVS